MPEWCDTEDWCPVTVTAELLGRKWTPVIVHRLLQRDMGFNELKDEVHGISAKMLSDSLEDLRDHGVVKKEIIQESPKQVVYCLTDRGGSLEPVIRAMADWAHDHVAD